ncbi:MAG TPA: hypothetical protein PLW95_03875 [bacterium]|nr:hypothetical protein [bacterium]
MIKWFSHLSVVWQWIIGWTIINFVVSLLQKFGEEFGKLDPVSKITETLIGEGKKPWFITAPFLIIYHIFKSIYYIAWLVILFLLLLISPFVIIIWECIRYFFALLLFIGRVLREYLFRPEVLIQIAGIIINFVVVYWAVSGMQGGGTNSIIRSTGIVLTENIGFIVFLMVLSNNLLDNILKLRIPDQNKTISPDEKRASLKNLILGLILVPIISYGLFKIFLVDYNYNVEAVKVERELLVRGLFGPASKTFSLESLTSNIPPEAMGWVTVVIPVICGIFSFQFYKKPFVMPEWKVPLPYGRTLCGTMLKWFSPVGKYLLKSIKMILFYIIVIACWCYFLIDPIFQFYKNRKEKNIVYENNKIIDVEIVEKKDENKKI